MSLNHVTEERTILSMTRNEAHVKKAPQICLPQIQ